MNKTPKEAVELINQLKPLVAQAKCDVVVCPPAVCLAAASEALKGSNIKLGAPECALGAFRSLYGRDFCGHA